MALVISHTVEAIPGELCEADLIEARLEPALRALLPRIRRDWSFRDPDQDEAFLADTRLSRYAVHVAHRTAVVNRWSVRHNPETGHFLWSLYWFWEDQPTRQLCTTLVETQADMIRS